MIFISIFISAIFAAKNEECPANSEGAAERCEAVCQDLYLGTFSLNQTKFGLSYTL